MNKKILIFEYLIRLLPRIIKNKLMINRPVVFILGTGRSGTTYLTKLLKTQEKLSVYPTEANNLFHTKLYPYNQRRPNVPPIWIDGDSFSSYSSNEWNSKWLINIKAIFGVFTRITKGKVFVCKTVMLSFLLDKLHSIFPDAKFVFLIRNGYSVVHSQFRKEFKKFQDPIYNKYIDNTDAELVQKQLAKFWNRSNINIHNFIIRNSNKCLIIKYEDLVAEPNKWMEVLGNFMGSKIEINSKYDSLVQGLKDMNYKADLELHANQKVVIENEIKEAMTVFGYQ